MMLPNQINTQRFTTVGKGGYRASEVDAFIQKVFQNYNKLYNDNNLFKERLSSITPLIDEYNENKKAIANALIWAQTTSDRSISEAKVEAKNIIDSAAAEAEKILADKKAEAEAAYAEKLSLVKAELEEAEKKLERVKNETKALSDKYINEINLKAGGIIDEANANASKIVADAYNDAKTAREKADAVIAQAEKDLAAIKNEAAAFRSEFDAAVKKAASAISAIEISDIENSGVFKDEKIEAKQIDKNDIEEFNLMFDDAEAEEIKADEAEASHSKFEVETVIDDVIEEKKKSDEKAEDFISGSVNSEMPDVNAYISKIFESAGNEDSDFSSFSDGLNDLLAQSLEENNISFEELQKSIDKDVATVEE